jgi:hypothetical protein
MAPPLEEPLVVFVVVVGRDLVPTSRIRLTGSFVTIEEISRVVVTLPSTSVRSTVTVRVPLKTCRSTFV